MEQTQALNDALKDANVLVAAPLPGSVPDAELVLAPGALLFVAALARTFEPRRGRLIAARDTEAERIAAGGDMTFLAETERIRKDPDWRVRAPPADLERRTVEITGPVSPAKMVINALNSGANTYMADFEDSVTPSWVNVIDGHANMRGAVRGTLRADTGDKVYTLKKKSENANPTVLLVRPRGWHMLEKHVYVDGRPVSASLFDFGLFFFHNAAALVAQGSGPYLYLPKMQSYLEARLWNDVFVFAQQYLGLPLGTVRATVLIETIHAAFQMEEILYELREHSTGLNCGRWDYLFSYIKTFLRSKDKMLPNRDQVGMTAPFMQAYVTLLVETCHRRGAHAIGGMAATIPNRRDEKANAEALAKVRTDKQREVRAGHDGTWVAHPGLIPVARDAFEEVLRGAPHQVDKQRDPVRVTPRDLVTPPSGGTITMDGVRENVRVTLLYLSAWLSGLGCVPLFGKMEDLATAEISRLQLNQWVYHRAALDGSSNNVSEQLVNKVIDESLTEIKQKSLALVSDDWLHKAAAMLRTYVSQSTTAPDLFMSSAAYDSILSIDSSLLRQARARSAL